MTTTLESLLSLSVSVMDTTSNEPVAVTYKRPLSPSDAVLIDSLIKRYVGIDQPLVVSTTDEEVTLRIPRIRRVFS